MLLDAHMHPLDMEDREGMRRLLDAFAASGEARLFCNTDVSSDWEPMLDLSRSYPGLVPFYGIHPWFTQELEPGWADKLALHAARAGSGIGEIGLDTLKGATLEAQKHVFERQVALACEFRRPFVLHCVRAWGEVMDVLHRHRRELPPFMVHGFGSSRQLMDELLELGAYLSFWLKDLERRPEKLKPLLAAVAGERLLLETDFPNCRHDKRRDTAEVYRDCLERLYVQAAALRGIDGEDLKRVVLTNGSIFANPAPVGQR